MEKHMAVCPYCGAGCKMNLVVENGQVIDAEGLPGITNEGELCLKGMYGYDFVNDTKILTPRIYHPMIRRTKGAPLERVTWDEALDFTAERLRAIIEEHGAESVMLTGSSRGAGNEANYVMQKFTRACLGTNNIDNCARTCHAASVIGLMEVVGSGAMSVSIPTLEETDCILLFGYNPAASHPIVARRIVNAKERGADLIVCDPRVIEAGTHRGYVPAAEERVEPGVAERVRVCDHRRGACRLGFHRRAHDGLRCLVGGRAGLRARGCGRGHGSSVRNHPPGGAPLRQRRYGCHRLGDGRTTQQAQRRARRCAPSPASAMRRRAYRQRMRAGFAPVRGQNNVQGSCDMGMLPNLYPGYQKRHRPGSACQVCQRLGASPEEKLPLEEGYKLTDLGHLVDEGKVHCFYNYGEDPVQTEPDSAGMRKTLSELDLFICQDIFMTQTTTLADVILPATSWGEHEGVFTASDR